MRDRIESFMRSEGLTPSRLADILGVQPSSISHLLSGRNKPGFEFVFKIMERFPALSPDWFILGTGSMYRESGASGGNNPVSAPNSALNTPINGVEPSEAVTSNSGDSDNNNITNLTVTAPTPATTPITPSSTHTTSATSVTSTTLITPVTPITPVTSPVTPPITPATGGSVPEAERPTPHTQIPENQQSAQPTTTKIVIFYNDNTFKEYTSR